jgi:hypothetical protein
MARYSNITPKNVTVKYIAKTFDGPIIDRADKNVRVTNAAQQYVTMVLAPNALPRMSVGNNSDVKSH